MKKLLALVLALVMTLSLATVSTNAAFEDAADISYTEAADVLSAVGVFVGDGKNFAPKAALNREQAAKLVAYLALGEEVAEALPAVAMFDDVAASSWAAKYIAYCADAGIITGDGAGKFFPAAPVDGYAFAKMLLCALGYKAEAEGYTGSNWSINVAKDAKELDLAKGGVDLTKGLTREQAAQMMFNAIKCKPVKEYKNVGTSVSIGGVDIQTSWGNAELETKTYYELTWDTLIYTDGGQDAYGRNAHSWDYESDDVGTYADATAKFVFTAKTSAKAMAAALKGYYLETADYKVDNDTAYTATLTVEGAENASYNVNKFSMNLSGSTTAEQLANLTANGKVVEMYAGTDKVIDEIVVVDFTFGEIYDVKVDKKTGYASYQLTSGGAYYSVDPDATNKAVLNGTFAEEDYVTYVALGSNKVVFYPVTMKTGTISAYDADAKTYTFNGDTVKIGEAVNGSLGLNSTTAKYYFDQYGYMVKTDAIGVANNYAFIVSAYGKDTTNVNGTVPSIEVKAVLADGTVGVYSIKLDKKSSNYYFSGTDTKITSVAAQAAGLVNKVYKFDLDGTVMKIADLASFNPVSPENGTYRADYVVSPDTIDNKDTTATVAYAANKDTTMLLNSKTTFVAYDSDKGTAKVMVGNGSIDGYQFDYATASDVVFGYVDGVATVKYVFSADYNTSAEKVDAYGYIDYTKFVQTKDGDDTYYAYTLTLTDGSTVTVKAKNTALDTTGLYEYNTDFSVEKGTSEYDDSNVITKTAANVVDTLVELNGAYYNLLDDTKIVDVSDDYDAVDDAQVIAVLKVKDGVQTNDLEAIFIVNA